ncbi:MAG: ribonuclease E/G, partial [Bacteroidia bacterium]|nr:ribonuclease E/G [Bacteroidia bacterium]
QRWERLANELPNAEIPKKVLSEVDRTTSLLRDLLSIGFDCITTDDKTIFHDIQEFLEKFQPDAVKNLRYQKPKIPLFEFLGIEKQIRASFGKTVNLSNGSYLVIEHTEALHVIDVNSGSSKPIEESPEENSLRINLEAAAEVARQLRLRDMGGIIVVDFIDLKKPENKKLIFEQLSKEMSKDRAKHTILPMSKFGLIQLTRQRVRPEINIVTTEVCPSCNGRGLIQSSMVIADEIETNIEYLIRNGKHSSLKIVANPFVVAFFQTGFPTRQWKWFFKYWKWIELKADPNIPFTVVRYYDRHDDELKLIN